MIVISSATALGQRGELPPNDWESLFGGSAWAPAGDGQWYFHCFAAEQPDLNWESEEVREDFRRTVRFWADRGADGFRIDVAHGLRKDMSEPYPPWGEIADLMRPDGSHPLWDRDDVHEIYADWRRIFNSYDPPRYAVAEAAVHPTRRALYASADSLGNAFNFDMQDADWRADDYRHVINSGLADMINNGSTTSWLLGCHDTPRVATRYGLPQEKERPAQQVARAWLLTDGATPRLDRELGARRARAAIMILLALPGSTYIYQGDELGLHEVADLPRGGPGGPDGHPLDDGEGPRRVPSAAAVEPGGAFVRVRCAGWPPATARLVWGVRGERSGGRSRLDAESLPQGAGAARPAVRWHRPQLG